MFLGRTDDAVSTAGEVHKVVFENEVIRVLDVLVPAGYLSPEHWHPSNTGYVLEGGPLRFFDENGTSKDVVLSTGQVTTGEGVHRVQNVGQSQVRVLQIEYKQPRR
jgi:beta-alanine degradation protein BauB